MRTPPLKATKAPTPKAVVPKPQTSTLSTNTTKPSSGKIELAQEEVEVKKRVSKSPNMGKRMTIE